jgi:excisionase family DNA binding protein
MPDLSEFVAIQEAARVLKVSEREVRGLIGDGRLPAERFGRIHIIRRADLGKVHKARNAGRSSRRSGGKGKSSSAAKPA